MEILQVHSWQFLLVSNSNSHRIDLIRSNRFTQGAEDHVTVKYRILRKCCSVDSSEEILSKTPKCHGIRSLLVVLFY